MRKEYDFSEGERGAVVAKHARSLHGVLAPVIERSLLPEDWEEARAAVWVEAVRVKLRP